MYWCLEKKETEKKLGRRVNQAVDWNDSGKDNNSHKKRRLWRKIIDDVVQQRKH